jgi:NAD(P)H-dependent FMN reductase
VITRHMTNILGIAGSLRLNSYSTRTLKLVLEKAATKYASETNLIDLREMELPIYNPNISSENDKILTCVTREVVKADSYVLASPDYHGSMSGAMKNLLDYYWKEFAGKTFGYIVASHEKGLTVMDQMRTAVRQCYGWSMPYGISIHGDHDFDQSGHITNSSLSSRLEMLARDLTVYGKLLRDQFITDINGNDQFTFARHFN